jgi:hypothetical protein
MSNVFKKNKFTNISNILPKVVEGLGLDRRLNEQAFFCLWASLVDEVYINRSIPLYIDQQNVLIVAVENSSTAQELSFIKAKLVEKIRQIAPQFGLTIDGLRFDLKQYNLAKQQRLKNTSVQNINNENISLDAENEQLKALVLTDAELKEISNFREAMEGAASNLEHLGLERGDLIAERIVSLMEKRLRLKKWHQSQNLPFCKLCHEPLFQPAHELCHYCLQLEKQSLKR